LRGKKGVERKGRGGEEEGGVVRRGEASN